MEALASIEGSVLLPVGFEHFEKLVGAVVHQDAHLLHIARGEGGSEQAAGFLPPLTGSVHHVLLVDVVSAGECGRHPPLVKICEVLDLNFLGQFRILDDDNRVGAVVKANEVTVLINPFLKCKRRSLFN